MFLDANIGKIGETAKKQPHLLTFFTIRTPLRRRGVGSL
jgi:hypothetical protein